MTFEEPIYRPPWEAASVLLPLTQSCNWNRCKFCYRSKDYKFVVAPAEVFECELKAQLPYYPPDARVFFVGSNNFALPTDKLLIYLDIVNRYMPEHDRISMFSRVDAIARKTDEQLRELAEHGCAHLYVGTESGSDEALDLMDKGHKAEEAVKQLRRLDEAGITYTVFYILGLGGKGTAEKSAEKTAALFNQVHPTQIVTTGMTVTEGTGAWDMRENGEYIQASEREMIEELRTFLQNLRIGAVYDGTHALNPVHYRFDTGNPEQKRQVLADLERILSTYTDEQLEEAIRRSELEESCKPVHLQKTS
ncbi:MAG: radical SAM protein [Clostridia bacterium]|nr:radical SAM protein [Clostridia bacterium]